MTEALMIDSDSLEHLEVLTSSVALAFAALSHRHLQQADHSYRMYPANESA